MTIALDTRRRPRRPSPLILAIAAGKGGVGKTTSALYIAAQAARLLGGTAEDPAVGIIDRDESRNLTKRLRLEPDLLRPGTVFLAGESSRPRTAAWIWSCSTRRRATSRSTRSARRNWLSCRSSPRRTG